MFKPKYNITSDLLTNIKKINELIIDLNHRRFPEVILMKFEKRARETSAHTSTSIEGNPLPLTEVKRILKNKPEHIRDSQKEILNYNQALIYLNNLIDKKKIKFNLKLILKIQKMITRGLITDYRCGKLRTEPVFVNNPKLRQVIYLPPDYKDVSKLTNELIEFININKNKIDPLILAGIFHKQFVIIHPFMDGNGRTTRLATKILLANMGLNTFNLFSFENYYNNNVDKYFIQVGARGNYYDLKDKIDFTDWLLYFTDGIIDELLRVGEILKKESLTPDTALKPYHKKIIEFIEKNSYISDRDYAKLTDRAKPTRNLDFNKLIKLELIKRFGKGKATYYKLK